MQQHPLVRTGFLYEVYNVNTVTLVRLISIQIQFMIVSIFSTKQAHAFVSIDLWMYKIRSNTDQHPVGKQQYAMNPMHFCIHHKKI